MSSTNIDLELYQPRCFCPPYLMTAVYETLRQPPGTLGRVGDHLRNEQHLPISDEMLYRYASDPTNPSDKHKCLPIRLLIPLIRASKNLAILDALEHHAGRHIPATQPPYRGTINDLIMHVLGHMAQGQAGLIHAMKELNRSARGLEQVLPLVRDLRNQLDVLEATVQARAHKVSDE